MRFAKKKKKKKHSQISFYLTNTAKPDIHL